MEWTPELDQKLLSWVAQKKSRRSFAREHGISENACIARYNRLNGVLFPSDRARGLMTRAEAAKKRKAKESAEALAIADMARKIRRGVHRREAMSEAREAGVRLRSIAKHFGVSYQAIQQYAPIDQS